MNHPSISPEERFAMVVEAFLGKPGVTPPMGRGFGSSGLRLHGKIFAMLASKGAFVVKLPRQRVDELIASGNGEYFGTGHGRVMKEWLSVAPLSDLDWLPLAEEAMAFAAAKY